MIGYQGLRLTDGDLLLPGENRDMACMRTYSSSCRSSLRSVWWNLSRGSRRSGWKPAEKHRRTGVSDMTEMVTLGRQWLVQQNYRLHPHILLLLCQNMAPNSIPQLQPWSLLRRRFILILQKGKIRGLIYIISLFVELTGNVAWEQLTFLRWLYSVQYSNMKF